MKVQVYKDGQFRQLAGNKIYRNGNWETLTGKDRIYFNGAWYSLGSSGGSWTSSGTVLNSGMTSSVMSAETWIDTTINSGGLLTVSNGGTANETHILGGNLYISSGGTANDTTVDYFGRLTVSSGGIANGLITNNRAIIEVNSGGSANGVVLAESATFVVNGEANSTTINFGSMDVGQLGGVSASASSVIVNGGYLTISTYGTGEDITVNSAGVLFIMGQCSNVVVNSGGYVDLGGGNVTSVIVQPSGGFNMPQAAGSASYVVISSGANAAIYRDRISDLVVLYGANVTYLGE